MCLGHQGIIDAFGGKVTNAGCVRHGKTSQVEHTNSELFKDVKNPFRATRYHSLVGDKTIIPDVLRSITTFFNAISSFDNFEDNLGIIQMIGEGSVGDAFASMFTTFINNKLDKLVTPKDLLTHDNEQYILNELRSCIGKDDTYRADIASTLATRLGNYSVVYSQDNTINQKITDRLKALCTMDYFTNDLKYLIVRTIFNGNKKKFNKLMMIPEIVKMTMK